MKTTTSSIGFAAVLAAFATSCMQATSFTGSPHVLNGRAGCEAKCRGQGMELVGMVYMGEYSDACVCAVPGEDATIRDVGTASASVAAGAAGVAMQMQEEERRRQQNYQY